VYIARVPYSNKQTKSSNATDSGRMMGDVSAQLVQMAALAVAERRRPHPEVQLQRTRILQFSIAAEAVRGRLLMRMECSYWVGR